MGQFLNLCTCCSPVIYCSVQIINALVKPSWSQPYLDTSSLHMVGWERELGKCKWENSWVERESKSCTRKQSKTRDYFTISHAQGSVQPFPAKQGSIPLSDSGRQTPLLRFFQSPISQACWDKLAAKPACMASWHHQRHKQWVSAGDLYSEDHVLWYFRGT